MRIIDKRKDYFDNVVPFSPDPVWVRKESTFVVERDDIYRSKKKKVDNPYNLDKSVIERISKMSGDIPNPYTNSTRPTNSNITLVGFCGKFYVVYHKDIYLGRPQDIISAPKPSIYINKWNNSLSGTETKMVEKSKNQYSYFGNTPFTDKALDAWYFTYGDDKMLNPLFRVFNSPVFFITSDFAKKTITINPLLLSVGFQCVIDPWTAYMEIERYLGNELVLNPLDDFKMTDEMKRDSKGMDNWSFKQKGPKARKRK